MRGVCEDNIARLVDVRGSQRCHERANGLTAAIGIRPQRIEIAGCDSTTCRNFRALQSSGVAMFDEEDVIEQRRDRRKAPTGLQRDVERLRVCLEPRAPLRALFVAPCKEFVERKGQVHTRLLTATRGKPHGRLALLIVHRQPAVRDHLRWAVSRGGAGRVAQHFNVDP